LVGIEELSDEDVALLLKELDKAEAEVKGTQGQQKITV
jgi:hypothetical protein